MLPFNYREFEIRDWRESDRQAAASVIEQVLQEYGLSWEAEGADKDVLQVKEHYIDVGGEFWVVEARGQVVGTAAYYPVRRGEKAVEIRKMYLLPDVRGKGLGKFLLGELEKKIRDRGFGQIWVETASVLQEAVQLYEGQGYQRATGVETARCDRVYFKDVAATAGWFG